MLRRAASRGLQTRLAAISCHHSGTLSPLPGCSMSRQPSGRPQQQQRLLPPGRPPATRWRLASKAPHSRRDLSRLMIATRAQPSSSSSSSPAAAVLAAAAAVASAAGSGLGRLASPSAPSAAAIAFSTAAASPSSPPPPSPSRPASPTPLEGTPVPWACLGPSASSPSPSPSPPLDLIQQRFLVGPATFRLVAPRDVDAVMDRYLEQGLLDADPYWTRAWPSAIALAATLLQRPELVAGKVVADLGAGLGLAGMAAALAGAREVVLLDREPAALQCALLSAAATGLDSDPDPDLDPGRSRDPAQGAGPRRHRVEPLPADQLPSYAVLQLTPPYRHLAVRQQAGQEEEEEEEEGGREREWGALMALARRLRPGDDGEDARPRLRSAEAAEAAEAADASDIGGPGSGSGNISNDSGGCSSSSSSSSGNGSGSVLRAHVFDWTSPPAMDRLLPAQQQQQQQAGGGPKGHGRQKGGGGLRQRRFDVVLACDVLYEDAAVGPIAGLMPLLLEPDGGRLLLADPPNRTVRNRERFLELLRGGPLRLSVEECSLQQCEVSKLDNEMAGGLAPTAETVPVQFLVFRSSLGNDTVGLKL